MLQCVQQGVLPVAFVRKAIPAELLLYAEPLQRVVPVLAADTRGVWKRATFGGQRLDLVAECSQRLRDVQKLRYRLQNVQYEPV